MSRNASTTEKPDQSRDPATATAVRFGLVAISLLAGFAYPFVDGRFGPVAEVILKGTAVGALAVAAAISGGAGYRWLTAIMLAGAIGDMLLAVPGGLSVGGGAFAVGHVIAIIFYLRNRDPRLGIAEMLIAAALIGYGAVIPGLIISEASAPAGLGLYLLLLCAMAAAAWASRFPRRWTALGALLFVISDTFLILRLGGVLFDGDATHGLIVWFTYYLGQLGIFIGISIGLSRDRALGTR